MRIDTSFSRNDIAPAMAWLSSQVGGLLKKKVADLEARQSRNPLFRFYCGHHFALDLALGHALRRHQTTSRFPRGDPYDLAYGFVLAAERLYHCLNSCGRKQLAGRLRDSMTGNYGLRPRAYEISILTHLCRRGFDVECADLGGKGDFDFLATRSGDQLEIECKTTAPDAGLKVHFKELSSLAGYILPTSRRLLATGGYHLIRIQAPDRLDATDRKMKAIACLVEAAVSGRQAGSGDLAVVEHRELDAPATQSGPSIEDLARAMFAAEFGVENGSIMYHGRTHGDGFVAVAVQSAKPDTVVDTLSERAKEAAKQCSGKRPAIVAMQLLDISEQALQDAVYKHSGLYEIASAVFKDGRRGHVNSIVFHNSSCA
jgi:hypothetical protein